MAEDPFGVHLSIVSPVYLAEDCLAELYRRVRDAVEPISPRFELILVDDASPDRSWSRIESLAREDPRVRGIQLSRNFGQHNAITAGLRHAKGEWVVVMDCDLQDPPEDIPVLYRKAQEGHACVLGRRSNRQDGAGKRFLSWSFYKVFNWLADVRYDPTVANFSIVSRQVVDELARLDESGRFYGGLLSWLGYADTFVDIGHNRRFAGRSAYTFGKLLRHASSLLLSYSTKPLRIVAYTGLSIAAVSVLAGAFYLGRALLYGSPVTGWASLIISIYFSTGAIMMTIGVTGLYVGRIFLEVKHRPLFVVRRRIGISESGSRVAITT